MTNKKLTLGCPIRKLHFYAQSESHTESYKQNLDTFADSPSGYDHATVSTFIGWCPSFHYHLLLKLLNSIIRAPILRPKVQKQTIVVSIPFLCYLFIFACWRYQKQCQFQAGGKCLYRGQCDGEWLALYFESTEHKLEKRLSRGRRGGGLYAIAWSATRALQGNLRLRAQTLCLLFAFLGERFHEISLCLTFIGGLLLSAPQN